jgi:hypothetical protein
MHAGSSVVRSSASLAGAVGALVFLLATPSHAATTVGADLNLMHGSGFGCPNVAPRCTFATTAVAGQYVSPIDGVVVRWRLKEDSTAGKSVNLRVLRPGAMPGTFFGAGRSNAEVTDAEGVFFGGAPFQTFATRLPIRAGDRLGMDGPFAEMNAYSDDLSFAEIASGWEPELPEGEPASFSDVERANTLLLINADVEPDADCDGFGDETQDPAVRKCLAEVRSARVKKNRLRLELSCPLVTRACDNNRVTVTTTKRLDPGKLAAASKRKRILLGQGTFSLQAGAVQIVSVKLGKQARRLFSARKQAGSTVSISRGAESSAQRLRVKRK